MIQIRQESLKPLARKYIWWETPEEAVAMPQRVLAQVMNIGDYADVQALVSLVGMPKRVSSTNAHGRIGTTALASPAWATFRRCLCGLRDPQVQ
jgi:hypothetical protein